MSIQEAVRAAHVTSYLARTRLSIGRMTDEERHAAWEELHAANDGLGWFVGRPAFEPHLLVPWSMYAFDPTERPKVGHRSREWTATAPTEERVIREMARCLRELGAGRLPK